MPFYQGVKFRQLQPEMMDQPDLDANRHRQALRGLARINFWSRSADILWRPLYRLQSKLGRPIRILDLGCGGGDVLERLAKKAQRDNLPMEFTGCDVSPQAVEYALQRACSGNVKLSFFVCDVLHEPLPTGFDAIVSSLFLHHLTNEQALALLRRMADQSEGLILVNDLLRSPLGLLLAHIGTRLLSLSPVVHFDGPRSVEGAFTREEVSDLTNQAGLTGATIVAHWPQRFLLSWSKL